MANRNDLEPILCATCAGPTEPARHRCANPECYGFGPAAPQRGGLHGALAQYAAEMAQHKAAIDAGLAALAAAQTAWENLSAQLAAAANTLAAAAEQAPDKPPPPPPPAPPDSVVSIHPRLVPPGTDPQDLVRAGETAEIAPLA